MYVKVLGKRDDKLVSRTFWGRSYCQSCGGRLYAKTYPMKRWVADTNQHKENCAYRGLYVYHVTKDFFPDIFSGFYYRADVDGVIRDTIDSQMSIVRVHRVKLLEYLGFRCENCRYFFDPGVSYRIVTSVLGEKFPHVPLCIYCVKEFGYGQ